MLFGVCLPNGGSGADPHLLAELAHKAEQAGWDGVFVEDHLVHHSGAHAPTVDPWVALAAISLATERVLIGTQVTPLARRRAWKVAREAVTLDHLSRGRFVLGVGLGGDIWETGYAMVGEDTDPMRRARRLDDGLTALAGLWTGEPFTFEGEGVHLTEAVFLPRPVQQPRIPVWVGGTWPRPGPSERAARWDGFIPLWRPEPDDHHIVPASEVTRIRSFITERRGSLDDYAIVIGGAERNQDWESERARIAELEEAGATWWVEYIASSDPDQMRRVADRAPLRPT